MDYKNCIGEKVVSSLNNKGVITKVDESAFIHIKFENNPIDCTFMFNPFINGQVRFIKKELQDEIDKEIEHIEKTYSELVNKCETKEKSKAEFYITMDRENKDPELVIFLDCSLDDAYKCFDYVVQKQKREYKKSNSHLKWRVVKMFDKSDSIIAQES